TLVFATEQPLASPEDFRVGAYFVYKRPGLEKFIGFAMNYFRVAVWTASSADYAAEVLTEIFPDVHQLEFAWSRERCTRRVDPELQTRYWTKDLKKLSRRGYLLDQILVIDDTPRKLERNYGNHIGIPPFHGDRDDGELEKLQEYLVQLKDVNDVRTVEKRYW